MPQVPYQPVPNVTPTEQGPGPMRVEVPGAAFGTNVAAAVQSVGGDLDKAGNELFARAMAMQDLQNRADADQAFQNFIEEQGKLHADFNTLQGQDRTNAFPKYIQDTHELRDRMGVNLNPAAQKLYNTESRSQAGRMIFSGATLAADAQKDFLIKNAEAGIQLLSKTVSDNPQDDATYEQSIKKARDAANYLSNLRGMGNDSDYEKLKVKDEVSKITLNRLIAMNQDHQPEAMEMFDRLKGRMNEVDKDRAYAAINGHGQVIATQNIVNEVTAGVWDDKGKQVKSAEMSVAEGTLKAKTLFPDNPVVAKKVADGIRSAIVNHNRELKLDDYTSQQTVFDYIYDHPEIRTEQQLRTVPEIAQILDNMNFKGQGINAQGAIARRLDQKFREVNTKRFNELYNMAIVDPQKFMEIDPFKEQVNDQQVHQLLSIRKGLLKQNFEDPHLNRALMWMRQAHGQTLQQLSIYNYDKNSPDDYLKYSGAMFEAINAWQKANNKMPQMEDVTKTIGPAVLQEYSQERRWYQFSGSNVPEYKMDIPGWFRDEARKVNPNINDIQLRTDYNAMVFQKLFGQSTNRSAKGDQPGGPTVPQSK